jgi:PKD repeat protein
LKEKKQNMSMRELFSQKLENAEIIPDASVRIKLMRKIGRQEFLRFNPARFNIYYLTGILATVITAIIILSPGSENSGMLIPPNIYEDGRTDSTIIQVDQTVIHKSEKTEPIVSRPLTGIPVAKPKDIPVADSVQNLKVRENTGVTQTGVIISYSKRGLFTETSPEKNLLRGGLKTGTILFETSASEGCTPLKIRFNSKSDSFDSCRWSFGDGGYSNEKNPEWIFDVEGEYKVVLNVFVTDGLKSTSASVVTVYPKPLARFEVASEKAVLREDEISFYNYSTNAIQFKWDFGDGSTSELFEPRHIYSKYGNYNVQLVVTSENGCSDSLTLQNALSGSEYYIDFPNAFIPDIQGPTGGYYSSKSDEVAKVFHPVFSGVSDYQLKIFSKSGILIFESSDINIGWDGYIKDQLSSPGVYIWKVRGNYLNGEPFIKMGDVILLRNP